ncbi:hypothetical protein BCR42DRAFT_405375 [Absidia repens]|uniref:Arf-GAP domain-containing protein n=1 Tax=Absidia repens TaxID=90262 RepID=A0A1X2ITC5_9FUNG|nr:hypothetical protein BCR42DRAFT_405375 [Absidia repens]
MSLRVKKQEEQDLQCIRELLRLPENKKCFDCSTMSPFFVNMTIQTFICARCSGLVREVGHRVKSISTSKFSGPETISLEMGGNGMAKRIWLHGFGGGDMQWIESDYDVRLFMRQKYYELRWFDRAFWNEHGNKVKQRIVEQFTEDGLRRHSNLPSRQLSVKTSSSPTSTNFILPPPPSSPNTTKYPTTTSLANEDDDCPLGLTAAAKTFVPIRPELKQQQALFSDDDLWTNSPISPTSFSPMITPISPTSTNSVPRSSFGDKPLETTPSSIIQPLAPPPPTSSSSFRKLSSPTTSSNSKTHSPTTLPPDFLSHNQQNPSSSSPPPTPRSIDPFADLRGLSF